MDRRERIALFVRDATLQYLKEGAPMAAEVDAGMVASALRLDRTNVSKLLNRLWDEGILIKVQGRPTLFLDRAVLEEAHKGRFFPQTMAGREELLALLYPVGDTSLPPPTGAGPLVGAGGSLRVPLQKARSACLYPPYGLPMLLVNPSRDDIAEFVHALFAGLQAEGATGPQASLIPLDCRGFEQAPGLFVQQLFGSGKSASRSGKAVRGCIEACNGGIIYLEGVHRLPERALEILIVALDRGSYCRVGEVSLRPLKACVVLSLPPTGNGELIKRLGKHVPVVLHLPDLAARGPYEKTQLVVDAFSREAQAVGRPLRVEKDVLQCFVAASFAGGRKELHNEVKLLCSEAYMRATAEGRERLDISCACLSPKLVRAVGESGVRQAAAAAVLAGLPNDYLFLGPGGSGSDAFIESLTTQHDALYTAPLLDTFRPDFSAMENAAAAAEALLVFLRGCKGAQVAAVEELVPYHAWQLAADVLRGGPYEALLADRKYLLGLLALLLHAVPARGRQTGTAEAPPEALAAVRSLLAALAGYQSAVFGPFELAFFALYLAGALDMAQDKTVSLLVVCHGASVASGWADTLRAGVGGSVEVEAIDCPPGYTVEGVLDAAVPLVRAINRGRGVLVAVDMPPLVSLVEALARRSGVPCKALAPASLPLLLEAAEKCRRGVSLQGVGGTSQRGLAAPDGEPGAGDGFMQRYIREVLRPGLAFLDTGKAVAALRPALDGILEEMHLAYSEEIAIKFFTHCAHMLERAILKEPMHYPSLKRFVGENHALMAVVEERLSSVARAFGIPLSAHEIAYTAEIFRDYGAA